MTITKTNQGKKKAKNKQKTRKKRNNKKKIKKNKNSEKEKFKNILFGDPSTNPQPVWNRLKIELIVLDPPEDWKPG